MHQKVIMQYMAQQTVKEMQKKSEIKLLSPQKIIKSIIKILITVIKGDK